MNGRDRTSIGTLSSGASGTNFPPCCGSSMMMGGKSFGATAIFIA
jgi:hypothetical protein